MSDAIDQLENDWENFINSLANKNRLRKPMKLAQFKSLTYGTVVVQTETSALYVSEDYVQVSDCVDVEFPQRPVDISDQLKKLAKKETQLRIALAEIQAQRAKIEGSGS